MCDLCCVFLKTFECAVHLFPLSDLLLSFYHVHHIWHVLFIGCVFAAKDVVTKLIEGA